MKLDRQTFSLITGVGTKTNILKSATLKRANNGEIAFATDTFEFYLYDSSIPGWRKVPFVLTSQSALPDMGVYQDSSPIGYGTNYITDKSTSYFKIGTGADSAERSLRTINGQFQLYLNGKWNNVVINFVFREDSLFGYTLENQPVGFNSYVEAMTGDSLTEVGANGVPIIQNYQADIGAYPSWQCIGGRTIN